MKLFLFNDIIPNSVSNQDIIGAFTKTVIEYKNLKAIYPDNIDGIISTSFPNDIKLGESLTLGNCLDQIENKDIRNYSYSIFAKYPIENHVDVDYTENEHIFKLGLENKDAFYIKIIANQNGVLFSLNLHTDLAKDFLTITSSNNSNFPIDNLYGVSSNTNYISEIIKNEELSKLANFEKLKRILNNPFYNKKFENSFNKESKEIQDLLIEGFEKILQLKSTNQNIPETLLNPVSYKSEKIHELKIRDPYPKRLYFKEINNVYYLASLEDKPKKDGKTIEQDTHIKNAISILKNLQ